MERKTGVTNSSVRFIPPGSWAAWGDDDDARAWWKILRKSNARPWIRNVETSLAAIELESTWLPVTINDAQYRNSYVCSPYTGAVTYPLDEIHKVDNRLVRFGLRRLVYLVEPWLRFGGINRAVSVNNWMLSTNLYPKWDGREICEITEMLVGEFPRHAIMFRSLNYATNAELCQRFEEAGYRLAPSRQVYFFDRSKCDFTRRRDTRRDRQLLEDTSCCTEVNHDALDGEDERIEWLYSKLYLKKYSYCNPQFTAKLIRIWREMNVMQFHGLRAGDGKLVGIVGLFQRGDILSAPIVGYDTSRPASWGLYRQLMAIVLREAQLSGLVLNLSSGAPAFKRNRGGQPEIEYSAVYSRHLPMGQRAIWSMLATLLDRIGRTVVTKFEL